MKKKILLGLSLICFLSLGSYGTMAYMKEQVTLENHLQFTGDKGLDAVLEEPGWDPPKGLLTLPGMEIEKDPCVTNTSQLNMNELVALKCEFLYTRSCPQKEKAGKVLSTQDMAYVADVYEIDYNSDTAKKGQWKRFSGQSGRMPVQEFYYNRVLKRNLPGKGETTPPLFTKLKIGKNVNQKRFRHIQDMGGFEIRLSGHVIQQMTGEKEFGLHSAENAYHAGLFDFKPEV